MTAPKRQRTNTSAARRNSMMSEADQTAPTLNVRPDGIVTPKQVDVLKISKRKSNEGKMQRTPSLKASIMITTTTPPKPLPPPAAKTYHGTIGSMGDAPSPQRSQRWVRAICIYMLDNLLLWVIRSAIQINLPIWRTGIHSQMKVPGARSV